MPWQRGASTVHAVEARTCHGIVDEVRGIAADASEFMLQGEPMANWRPKVGGFDAFLRKYDTNGNVIWTKQFGTNTTDQANAVAVNSTGVYVAGDTVGAFPGQAHIGGLWDVFAAKFDS